MFAFHIAEREGISPSEASRERYGWDVFAQFDFGPVEDESPPDERKMSRFDSLLRSLLDVKYEIRGVWRVNMAYKLAEKRDMTPEEVSRELYDENLIPETSEQSEGYEE